jgi:hypothetical protein
MISRESPCSSGVLSSTRVPVTAKRNFIATRDTSCFLAGLTLAFTLLIFPKVLQADAAEDAARLLARKVTAIPNLRGPLRLVWENGSGLTDTQADSMRDALTAELASRSVVLTEEASAAALHVSVRETPAQVLLIAVVQVAESDQVRIVELSRAAFSLANRGASTPRLQKELLWLEKEPILDAVEHTDSRAKETLLLVLKRDSLVIYRQEKTNWIESNSVPLSPPAPISRDARGAIRFPGVQDNHFSVNLPDRTCDGNLEEKNALKCVFGGEKSWQEGFFLASGCDHSLAWLVSDTGDWSVPDRLILRNPSLPKTAAPLAVLEIPGPALSISSGQAFRSDTAVIFNLSTGFYEVYRITLACGS